jgi:hypothetical protein
MNKKIAQTPMPPADYIGPSTVQTIPPITIRAPARNQEPATKDPAVEKMQAAVVNLYDAFKYYPMFNKEPNYRADQPIPTNPQEQAAPEYKESFEHGADTFLTFLLNRYINKSAVLGKENVNQGQNAQPVNFIRFLETLKIDDDGVWGKLTDNALKNVYAITSAILNIMNKLNITASDYTQENLQEFASAIQTRSSENANVITKHIAAIKRLLGNFMHAMDRENGKFSPFVRQDRAFQTNFSDQASKFDNADANVFRQMQARSNTAPLVLFSMPKDIGTNEGALINVPLSSLLNKQNFQNLITTNSITVNNVSPLEDADARNKLIDYIEDKIKAMQSAPAPIGSQIIQQPPF